MPRGSSRDGEGTKTAITNRKALRDYEILDRFEAGVVLTGAEVKSLRGGQGSLSEAYARIRGEDVWIEGMHIPPYAQQMDKRTYDPARPRKLLLHRKEVHRLIGTMAEKGFALVPLRAYFAHGLVKIELGLGRGRKTFEKREVIKERDAKLEMDRAARRRR